MLVCGSDFVASSLPCNVTSHHNPPIPPTKFVARQSVAKRSCRLQRANRRKISFSIAIDQYLKYLEVILFPRLAFKCYDHIWIVYFLHIAFSTPEMNRYTELMGFKLITVAFHKPQYNSFAENIVKLICKLIHTCVAKGKDPTQINQFLMQYRATSHSGSLVNNRSHPPRYFSIKLSKQSSQNILKRRDHSPTKNETRQSKSCQ